MNAPVSGQVVLVGPMASGKSSVGRELAVLLGLPFTDLDQVLVSRHGSIAELFAEHGEAHFRSLERQVLLEALNGQPSVLATGGGVVLDPLNREALGSATVVELQIDAATAAQRLGSDTTRPLLAGPDAITTWGAIAAARAKHYSSVAAITVDAATGTAAEVATAIAAAIAQNTPTRRTP